MKKISKIFLLIGALSFSALFISSPLLHNHPIDFENHSNCPVFILNITFASFTFIFLSKFKVSLPISKYQLEPGFVIYFPQEKLGPHSNRAPPFYY